MSDKKLKYFSHTLSCFFLTALLPLLFAGCQKTPINGNLDGQWEVIEVTPNPPQWNGEDRLFYSFGHHVCQLSIYGGPFTNGNLLYEDDTMTLYFPFVSSPSQQLQLKQYGIYSNPITFKVTFDSKNRMTLSNDESTVILKKF